ncbi:hypothetical protein PPL_08319 [Heterostelium album PN500]|uniref:KOW domain-containing protein n=1 Tax=Heterostelium pallidum (strain ATCC 26659 / Pp 5 / PN500) TaxID=670386 RepID=D3BHV3_HETP5|nr:hypothetical protein PPL_08319 [Heterostelium album PN500]EFA78853.1 hypothetical protein PPL_08319 [Heterostelium album PN500]|eukprot:XP_020430977.1 hypothetical protein PPL_08319 [Heterostelium album PN500]
MSTLFGGRPFKEGLYLINKWKFMTGDKVQILAGRDKGKQGIIKSVNRKHNNVLVEGLKLIKKLAKSTKNQKGGAYTKEAPIHYSNIAHIDPNNQKACRVHFQLIDGVRERISRVTNSIIPRPTVDLSKKWRKENIEGPLDTPAAVVKQKTYDGVVDSIDPRPTI